MKGAYYNEFEPYAAAWLVNLIKAGHLPAGDVDTRDIREVKPDDVRNYTQAHFFAGIGGWPYALRLAGWGDDRPVWTGSCPCQPFSAAGKKEGHGDQRHLWPYWYRLIRECRPAVVFGEQVSGAITFGWLDEVFSDMEKEAYTCASAVLPACAAGAFHRRDRLWFVGYAEHDGRYALPVAGSNGTHADRPESAKGKVGAFKLTGTGEPCNVADANGGGGKGREWLSDHERQGLRHLERGDGGSKAARSLADTVSERGRGGNSERQNAENADSPSEGSVEWVACPDGKSRPVKSGIRLLADGVPCRVAKLRAFGNAIDPRIATEFLIACMEARP